MYLINKSYGGINMYNIFNENTMTIEAYHLNRNEVIYYAETMFDRSFKNYRQAVKALNDVDYDVVGRF